MTQRDETADGPADSGGQSEAAMDVEATRDRLVDAAVGHVAFDGWGRDALHQAATDCGLSTSMADALFPNPARDLIAWHSRLADRRMMAALAVADLESMRIRDRIAFCVMTRLEQNADDRPAIRAALSYLALPQNAGLASHLLYRTVDDIWFAAGDRSTDWNFYSKRGLLAGVYSSTVLVWLNDDSEGLAETRAFLDRRIGNVMQIPKVTQRLRKAGRIATCVPRRLNALRTFRPAGLGGR